MAQFQNDRKTPEVCTFSAFYNLLLEYSLPAMYYYIVPHANEGGSRDRVSGL
jgi:hypothetical protein